MLLPHLKEVDTYQLNEAQIQILISHLTLQYIKVISVTPYTNTDQWNVDIRKKEYNNNNSCHIFRIPHRYVCTFLTNDGSKARR